MPINFGVGKRFPLPSELPYPLDNIPFSIKSSDYNLDGYPDIVAILKDSTTKNSTSVILKNQQCIDTTTCTYNRTFTPKEEETFVSAITNATLAVFFDILENVRYCYC